MANVVQSAKMEIEMMIVVELHAKMLIPIAHLIPSPRMANVVQSAKMEIEMMIVVELHAKMLIPIVHLIPSPQMANVVQFAKIESEKHYTIIRISQKRMEFQLNPRTCTYNSSI